MKAVYTMNKLEKILNKDFKIVEKRRVWFLIPLAAIILAAIMALVFLLSVGTPANLSMDFTGGYTLNASFSELSSENYSNYAKQIEKVAENLKAEDGSLYQLKIDGVKYLSDENDANRRIFIRYKKIDGLSTEEMATVNEKFAEEIENLFLKIVPDVSSNGSVITYGEFIEESMRSEIEQSLLSKYPSALFEWSERPEAGVAPDTNKQYYRVLTISNVSLLGTNTDTLRALLSVQDEMRGTVSEVEPVDAAVSGDLVMYLAAAFVLALFLAFFYIAFRFKRFSVSFAVLLTLLFDIMIVIAFMLITHIQFTATFLGAVVAIVFYSIFNTVLFFDKLRENIKNDTQGLSRQALANKSVKESLIRVTYTTAICFIIFAIIALVCGIAGATAVVCFAAPLLAGIVSVAFSGACIAPSLWIVMGSKKIKATTHRIEKPKVEPVDTEMPL